MEQKKVDFGALKVVRPVLENANLKAELIAMHRWYHGELEKAAEQTDAWEADGLTVKERIIRDTARAEGGKEATDAIILTIFGGTVLNELFFEDLNCGELPGQVEMDIDK